MLLNLILERKSSVRGLNAGKVLSFTFGLHWLEKNSLKRLAFSSRLMTNLSSTLRGGTLGALDLFTKFLRIFQ